jgi:hypothetical protein
MKKAPENIMQSTLPSAPKEGCFNWQQDPFFAAIETWIAATYFAVMTRMV